MTDKLQDFGHTFQIKSIASLMKNQTFLEQIHDILEESNYDSDSLKWIVKECKSYFDEYRKCITLDVFKVKTQEVENDILKVAIVESLKEVFRHMESPDLDFIQDKTPTTNHENDIFGIFGEIIHQTSPQLNNTIAVRNDGHSNFGEQFSFRVSSALTLDSKSNLKGSYGTGFRSPSLYELYDSSNGNADLKPEKSSNFDLEYSNNLNDSLKFKVAYFSNETEDIINWVANPPGGWVGKYEQTSTKKKREGFEISNIYNMSKYTSLDMSYSYIADENGGKIIRVPRNQLGLNLGTQFNDKLYFNGIAKHNTDICDTINGTKCDVDLDDYTLVNLLAKYKLYENTNLKLRIENIFNTSYQVINKFGTSPRAFYLSIDNAF